jgi:predicted nucleotidyltransferase
MFPFEKQTIFLTLAGSNAHGTAREGSDVDLRGVCICPLPTRISLFQTFEQYEGPLSSGLVDLALPKLKAHPTASRGLTTKVESVIFDIAKFVGLCAAANPNALEILFASERDWVLITPAWQRLHDQRNHFLTKKVQQTFLGYAMAQLKKIKTHRSWLLNPPTHKPAREDFGLPVASGTLSQDDQNRIEQSIADKIRSYGVDNIDMPKPTRAAVQERLDSFYRDVLTASDETVDDGIRATAVHALSLPASVVETLNAEKKYRSAMKHWESYQTWKSQRNPARAELERKHGYDTKHAMHLIRLMRMGLEVLQRGELLVNRPDAAELMAIRDGSLSFEELMDAAAGLTETMRQRAATQLALPDDVDYGQVNQLVVQLMLEVRD